MICWFECTFDPNNVHTSADKPDSPSGRCRDTWISPSRARVLRRRATARLPHSRSRRRPPSPLARRSSRLHLNLSFSSRRRTCRLPWRQRAAASASCAGAYDPPGAPEGAEAAGWPSRWARAPVSQVGQVSTAATRSGRSLPRRALSLARGMGISTCLLRMATTRSSRRASPHAAPGRNPASRSSTRLWRSSRVLIVCCANSGASTTSTWAILFSLIPNLKVSSAFNLTVASAFLRSDSRVRINVIS